MVDIERQKSQLAAVRERAAEFESRYAENLSAVHPDLQESARTLIRYLAVRQEDTGALNPTNPVADRHKTAILGERPQGRDVSIMVTMPSEAADNKSLVAEMLDAGMNVARINCARDDEQAWEAMIRNIRQASQISAMPCKIVMDLAGPKIRTGELRPGPRVTRIRPRRDPMGRIIAPRRIRLIPDDVVWQGTKVAIVPVPRDCIEYAHPGDEIRFKDTRGKKRRLSVIDKDDKGLVVELFKGAYFATGTKLRLCRREEGEKLSYRVGELPMIEQPLLLRPGDTLILHRDSIPGAPAVEDDDGEIIESAHISCRQPEAFEFVSAGDRISINDGKISGVVQAIEDEHFEIEITKAKPTGSRLRADRGINFPDSDIRLPGLTNADKNNLKFVIRHADAVSLSFVRRPTDIVALQDELDRLDAGDIGLIVKIETKKGFKNLPKLLLTAMRRYPIAVMIARGDLAIECGWERLAELQEDILWYCEAAEVPVIWATQVLEHKAKKGLASRAEVSDAAMSQRADCVMLNKGPHILAAIRMLDDILRRMQARQYKTSARLGRLGFEQEGMAEGKTAPNP
jgi:pyruvate kinase